MPSGVYKRKPFSQEHKEKLRKASTGRHLSEEAKKKVGLAQKGRKHKIQEGFQKGHGYSGGGFKKGFHCSPKTEFKKGHKNWNKGKTGLQTAWNKGLSGYKPTEKARINMSNAHKGNKSYFWKGGINSINDTIRKSIEMRLWREVVFARDNWTCQKTKIKGGMLHSHHIKNFAEFPELRFAIDNGITLSEKAHKEFHKVYGYKNNTEEQLKEFLTAVGAYEGTKNGLKAVKKD